MSEHTVLETLEYPKHEKYKTVVQLKVCNGELSIDVRKWFKRRGMDQFSAGEQGIQLEINDWSIVLPLIHKLLDSNLKT